jgi:hypothetical protein
MKGNTRGVGNSQNKHPPGGAKGLLFGTAYSKGICYSMQTTTPENTRKKITLIFAVILGGYPTGICWVSWGKMM